MQGKIHRIYYKGHAVCPKCGGYIKDVKSDMIIFHCIDCNTFYQAFDFGNAEAEFECEEVLVGTCD